jgi:hypothetical protein
MSLNQLLNDPAQPWSDLYCNSLTSEQTVSPKGIITQGTSTTTAVVLNARCGLVTTFTQTLAAASSLQFSVTNSFAKADSIISCTVSHYSGTYATNGFPQANCEHNVADGSFIVRINNLHTSNALSGVLKVSFTVL